jgi:hypothetical protein
MVLYTLQWMESQGDIYAHKKALGNSTCVHHQFWTAVLAYRYDCGGTNARICE